MHHLLKLLYEKGENSNILCVGDLMLDVFYYGEALRISPEAPIPVLRVERKNQVLGGVGNVANNLRTLSVKPFLVGIVGDDEASKTVSALLRERGIGCEGILSSPQAETIVKNRYVAQDQQLLRVDFEGVVGYEQSLTDGLLERSLELLRKAQILILSDYGKGALPPYVIEALLQEAGRQNKISIVDPKGTDYRIYRGATFVTPNRKELKEATGMPTMTDEEVVVASKHLIKTSCVHNVLATRSEKGMTLVKETGDVHHFKVVAKEVYDVSGAGDTVVSALGAALSVGDTVEEAVQLANLAGSVVVGKMGTATVSLQELEEALLLQDQQESIDARIVTLAQATERVQKWKEAGLKVGFTNGCFDLFHLGHLKVLSESRALCDRLIVGVNTDAYVRRTKGESRPIQDEKTRSGVLAALACVDLVILFEEDTPKILIETLIPNVLVKGGDYTLGTVVGADVVQSHGGTVHLVKLVEGHSTTNTVSRMRVPQKS